MSARRTLEVLQATPFSEVFQRFNSNPNDDPAAGVSPGSAIDVFLFSTFASDTFINRDFGVTAEQSVTSGLASTDLGSGYRSIGIQAAGRLRFGKSWQLQAEAGYEMYNSDIADSPIVVDDYEAEIGLSLLYRF